MLRCRGSSLSSFALSVLGSVAAVATTMSAVQKMQQRTQERQQIGQDTKQMCGVLRNQEEPTDGEKGK